MTEYSATGRSLHPQYPEARAAFDQLNAQLRSRLNFMLTGFTHVPDSGYPTFTVSLTSRQAELIAEALKLPTVLVEIDGKTEINNYDGDIIYVDYEEAEAREDYAQEKIAEVSESDLAEPVKKATIEALER